MIPPATDRAEHSHHVSAADCQQKHVKSAGHIVQLRRRQQPRTSVHEMLAVKYRTGRRVILCLRAESEVWTRRRRRQRTGCDPASRLLLLLLLLLMMMMMMMMMLAWT